MKTPRNRRALGRLSILCLALALAAGAASAGEVEPVLSFNPVFEMLAEWANALTDWWLGEWGPGQYGQYGL